MLTQVIIHYQHVLAIFHPLLTDGTARIRSNVLQRRQITCRRYNYGGVCHCAILFQCLYNIGDGGCFLAYCNINTFYVLALLINNRINCDCRLTCLTVTDNQLTLPPADGNHGVDGLNTRLKGRIYALSCDNTACNSFDFTEFCSLYRSLAVNRLTEGIDNTPKQCVSHRDFHHTSRGLDGIAFVDIPGASQQYHAHVILFQIQHHAVHFAGELQKLTLHGILQTMYTSNAVCYLYDGTHIGYVQRRGISLNLILDNRTYFFWS